MAADAKPIPMVKNDAPYTAAYLEKVHYDNWIGPAAAKPFNPNRFHYNWHWQFEYGGGDTANQGPHQFDVARWGLGREDYPVRVRSTGGLFLYKDSQQDTPNEQTSLFEYADGTVLEFGTRGLPSNKEGDIGIGVIFYGSEGRLEIDAEGDWKTFMGPKNEPGPDSKNIARREEQRPGHHRHRVGRPLRQLHRGGEAGQAGDAHLRHRDRLQVQRAAHHGEHRLPGRHAS